ncbi:hypothetical protein V6N13_076214 [Hibiscus sabdariffa]
MSEMATLAPPLTFKLVLSSSVVDVRTRPCQAKPSGLISTRTPKSNHDTSTSHDVVFLHIGVRWSSLMVSLLPIGHITMQKQKYQAWHRISEEGNQ